MIALPTISRRRRIWLIAFMHSVPSVFNATPTPPNSDLTNLSLPNPLILQPIEQSPSSSTMASIEAQQPQLTVDQRVEQPTTNHHPMVTRSRTGNLMPRTFSAAVHDDDDIEPTYFSQAYPKETWRRAMNEEFNALLENNTWTLEGPSPQKKAIGNKWVFKIKRNPDGSVARLVAKGFHQTEGIDYTETFSPVIKPATIRLILSIAVSRNWIINQLDVSNAFLHGTLEEVVYMVQPPCFADPSRPSHVCRLNKSLYGLKQAPRAWFSCLRDALVQLGFEGSKTDTSLFYLSNPSPIIVLIYVDNIIITGASSEQVQNIIQELAGCFKLKDLGRLSYFLGIEVNQSTACMHLTQTKYIKELLKKAGLHASNPVAMPYYKAKVTDIEPFHRPTEFRQLLGILQYLQMTRPDISYVVNKLSQTMHAPSMTDWVHLKRVLRYLKGTLTHGITL
ncbi:Retrovirus-related Pol polyprotein from transposon RE1 [Linum perenne]